MVDTITEMMRQTNALVLQGFGRFETKYRAPYTVRCNLPDIEEREKPIPGSYRLKFQPATKLNEAACEYFCRDDENEEKASE